MQLTETTNAGRTFRLDVTINELNMIEKALTRMRQDEPYAGMFNTLATELHRMRKELNGQVVDAWAPPPTP